MGLTLDTGVLIALEKRSRSAAALVARAFAENQLVTVPTLVVLEWWRGQRGAPARMLEGCKVEPLSEALARVAGEALAAVPGSTLVDAVVMASAASRGDSVYTSDFDDLIALSDYFRSVKVFSVQT